LYVTVFDMPLLQHAIVFVPVAIITAVLMTLAYRSTAASKYINLSYVDQQAGIDHNGLGLTKEQAEAAQDVVRHKSSMAYSFFYSNLLFFVLFLFFGFYVFRALATSYNFALSMLAAAGVVWPLSASCSSEEASHNDPTE
jgi:hypothetical protein